MTHSSGTAGARHEKNQPPHDLDGDSRAVVLQALEQVRRHRGWNLLAAHVPSNHVHIVVEADVPPEKAMNDFKAYASRALNQLGREESGPRR